MAIEVGLSDVELSTDQDCEEVKSWNGEHRRDGRTHGGGGAGVPETWTRHTRLQNTLASAGHSAQEWSWKAISKVQLIRMQFLRLYNSPRPRPLGSGKLVFPPGPLQTQRPLTQTERTLPGLLGVHFRFPQSCFLVLELLFDFLGSFFSKTV